MIRDHIKQRCLLALVIAMPMISGYAFAEELGRLFTSPQEREFLDALRRQPVPGIHSDPEPGTANNSADGFPHETTEVTVRGLVYRKGGNNTAWLHATGVDESIPESTVTPDFVLIENPRDRTSIRLKVGETWTP